MINLINKNVNNLKIVYFKVLYYIDLSKLLKIRLIKNSLLYQYFNNF